MKKTRKIRLPPATGIIGPKNINSINNLNYTNKSNTNKSTINN